MKVLVLGGTGAMGVHLVNLFKENGTKITVTSRSKRKSIGIINYVKGDAQDLVFLNLILKEKWDVVVDFMVYTTAQFAERVDLFLRSTKQYVFISTARVYAENLSLLKEDSDRLLDVSNDEYFLKTDEYSLTKARQENLLKQSIHSNWSIIRPYITYSKTRLQLGVLEKEDWLYRALQGRTIVFNEDMVNRLTTLTYGFDVAKGIFNILGKENALKNVYHITSNESRTWGDVLETYLSVLENHLGNRPKILLESLDSFLLHHPSKYQIIYDRFYNRRFDNSKISNYVNIKDFVNIDAGLKDCLEEFLKEPTFNHINWRKEAYKDRATNEFVSFSEINTFKEKIRYLLYRFLKK